MSLGIKLNPATIIIPESTSESISCTVRIGYTDSDTEGTINVYGEDLLSATGSIGISSTAVDDTIGYITIPQEWLRNIPSKVKVVNGAVADIDGALYVLFNGLYDHQSSIDISNNSGNQETSTYTTGQDDDLTMEGDFRAHIVVLASGDSYTTLLQPCVIAIPISTNVDFSSVANIASLGILDISTSIDVSVNKYFDISSYTSFLESTRYDIRSYLHVVANLDAKDFYATVKVMPSLWITSTAEGRINIYQSKRSDLSCFLQVNLQHGRDFDANIRLKRPSHKSIGCRLFIADHYATGTSQFGAMGASGGDIDSPAGIPPRPIRSHGIIPINSSRKGLSSLPSWMDMVKYSHSVGSQFFNAIDTELEMMNKDLYHQAEKYFIETCMPKLDTIGFAPLPPSGIVSATVSMYEKSNGDRYRWRLQEADSLHKFYHADTYYWVNEFVIPDGDTENLSTIKQTGTNIFDVYWIDEVERLVYFRFSNGFYNTVELNGTSTIVTFKHVWNELDDIGALLHIARLPNESNSSFRARILDIFDNVEYIYTTRSGGERVVIRDKYPDSTFIGLSTMIARELNIPAQDDAGNFNVQIRALSDRNFQIDELLDKNMLPNSRFIDYVNTVNKEAKITWETAQWDHSQWMTNEDSKRYPRLKSIWDILNLRNEIE